MAYIAGHFTITFMPAAGSAMDIGDTKDGITIVQIQHREPITGDSGGQTELDAVQAGGDVEVRLTGIEYDKLEACYNQQFPFGLPKSNVGKLMTDLAGVLTMTPVAGTSAATLLGASKKYQASKAIVISDLETLLKYSNREGPVTFRCYADPVTGKAIEVMSA